MEGNKRINVPELVAGDIGATLKLKNTHVNNTLHEKGKRELEPIVFPAANMSMAIESVRKEEEKLSVALHQLPEERSHRTGGIFPGAETDHYPLPG